MTPPREEARRLLRLALRDRETFDLLLPLPKASLSAIGFLAHSFDRGAGSRTNVSGGEGGAEELD